MPLTRVFKKGNFFVFQENDDLSKINTVNTQEATYRASTRHFFSQIAGQKYSFLFADILDELGHAYSSEDAFIAEMLKETSDYRSDQIIHRLVSVASTNDSLIRTGSVRLFGAILTNDAAGSLYVKYYNKATEPVVGTDIPVITVTVKTKESLTLDLGSEGILFDKGLGIGVTGAIPDADSTNTGINEMFAQTMLSASDVFVKSMEGVVDGKATVIGVMIADGALAGASNGTATVTGVLIDQI